MNSKHPPTHENQVGPSEVEPTEALPSAWAGRAGVTVNSRSASSRPAPPTRRHTRESPQTRCAPCPTTSTRTVGAAGDFIHRAMATTLLFGLDVLDDAQPSIVDRTPRTLDELAHRLLAI